jgi:hypothetical protein
MEKLPAHIEEQLRRYLDDTLTPEERSAFWKSLDGNQSLKRYIETIVATDELLRDSELLTPSKNFTAQVMDKLHQYPQSAPAPIRNGLLLLAGVLIILAASIISLTAGVFDNQTINFGQLSIAERYLQRSLPAIALDAKLLVNIILLLNLAIGFVVFDRAVLRPYFQRRLQSGV